MNQSLSSRFLLNSPVDHHPLFQSHVSVISTALPKASRPCAKYFLEMLVIGQCYNLDFKYLGIAQSPAWHYWKVVEPLERGPVGGLYII
jgi:hypothetical protein